MLREQIKRDFGLDLPISGGNGGSIEDAVVIETDEISEVSWVEMQVLRVVLGIRGWHWRCFDKQIVMSEKGELIEKVKFEAKYIKDDLVSIDKRNFYFNLKNLKIDDKKFTPLPSISLRNLSMVLPYQIGWLHYDSLIDNEAEYPGMGVSVAYSMPNSKATIYVYDKLEKLIDSKDNPTQFEREFDGAVSDFMAMNSNMGEPTYHKSAGVLSCVFVADANYSIICLGTYANKYVKLRLSSDDSLEAYKFHCIQDSTGAFCSFFN